MATPRSAAAVIEQMLAEKESPIDLGEFTREIMVRAGGIKGLAKWVWDEFEASKKGGQTRARLLALFTELIKVTTASEKIGDMGQLSEDDLERTAQAIMMKMGHGKEEITEGHSV